MTPPWEFQPLKDWSGDVALNYEVSDGLAWSATSGTLTIDPVNDAPVIDGRIDLGSSDEDTSFSFSTAPAARQRIRR